MKVAISIFYDKKNKRRRVRYFNITFLIKNGWVVGLRQHHSLHVMAKTTLEMLSVWHMKSATPFSVSLGRALPKNLARRNTKELSKIHYESGEPCSSQVGIIWYLFEKVKTTVAVLCNF